MNRYSLAFLMIVAASFVAPSPQAGDSSHKATVAEKKPASHGTDNADIALRIDPDEPLSVFLGTDLSSDNRTQKVLFASVPHPTETHLAADFDDSVDALESAIQDAGYLYDSSWIPWEFSHGYDRFSDNLVEKRAIDEEDKFPGLLFFRNDRKKGSEDPYESGLIVFLITEKPTQGLFVEQIQKAVELSKKYHLSIRLNAGAIGLVGPNYSGSLGSLGRALHALHMGDEKASLLMRSGVVDWKMSCQTIQRIASLREMAGVSIDFGSAHHYYEDWNQIALSRLNSMGITSDRIAFLSEGESSYGHLGQADTQVSLPNTDICLRDQIADTSWHVQYPRDISSLRNSYDEQGLLEHVLPSEPWKRFLTLKNTTEGNGDTVRSYGGASTIAAQESILFGISVFLSTHEIHAIVISATNEDDAYFLSQFFHANNSGVRIVTVGSSRLFLRGSTAQFRGDLVVDDFPMLPLLNDWTSGIQGKDIGRLKRLERIFSTGYAQGVYIATRDLLGIAPDDDARFTEYATPKFGANRTAVDVTKHPPMYLTALGSEFVWPVDANGGSSLMIQQPKGSGNPSSAAWTVEMPFGLFRQEDGSSAQAANPRTEPIHLQISKFWRTISFVLWSATLLYCACFLYARPVTRQLCASFEPVSGGRYWCFTVALPALLYGWTFYLLDSPVATLSVISSDIFPWHCYAVGSAIVAPLLIAVTACWKAGYIPRQLKMSAEGKPREEARATAPGFDKWKMLSFTPVLILALALLHRSLHVGNDALNLGRVLDAYRELHMKSGLSLLPTALLLCLAFFLWVRQASLGSAVMMQLQFFRSFREILGSRKSEERALGATADPAPVTPPGRSFWQSEIKWLWIVWMIGTALMAAVVFGYHSFRAVTTLQTHAVTIKVLVAILIAGSLMLLDLLQFFWVWDRLRGLLHALDMRFFKRSFVPIDSFKWSSLWSFAGFSFSGQKPILAAQLDCLEALLRYVKETDRTVLTAVPSFDAEIEVKVAALLDLRYRYRSPEIARTTTWEYRNHLRLVHDRLASIANAVAGWVDPNPTMPRYPEPREFRMVTEFLLKSMACSSKDKNPTYKQEAEDVTRLLPWQQAAERFLCLHYISFIQTIIARLHRLMISAAALFSSIAVSIAIYPFAPMSPFLLGGLVFLLLLAVAFYLVFSQMDRDPILSRIVNGDEQKLEWHFYGKFAEAIALPALTLMSSLLPGGTGRVMEVVTKLISHSQ